MAARLRAETAFAAGLGELDSVVGDRTADLWRYYSRGGTRLDEWRARWRAAPTRREAARVLASALLSTATTCAWSWATRPRDARSPPGSGSGSGCWLSRELGRPRPRTGSAVAAP